MICLGCFAGYEAYKLGAWKGSAPGGGLFPLFVAILFVILSVVALIKSRHLCPAPKSSIIMKKLVLYCVCLMAVAFCMEPVGYMVTIGVAFLIILRYIEKLSWTRTLAVTAGTLVVSSLIFEKLLLVDLPHGILW
jgi:hypothetical protein